MLDIVKEMARTTTKQINFADLAQRPGSSTVIKLMMACNDLSMSNDALANWKKVQSKSRSHQQAGAQMYFLRLQIAHLFEGLKIIEEIVKNQDLLKVVEICDSKTQESLVFLKQFLPGGCERKSFEKLAGKIRHLLAFHYEESGRLIDRAVSERAKRSNGKISSITRGSSCETWRFNVADDVVDSIVCRFIWNISKEADLKTEADKIIMYIHKVMLSFLDFSGEFTWKYCTR